MKTPDPVIVFCRRWERRLVSVLMLLLTAVAVAAAAVFAVGHLAGSVSENLSTPSASTHAARSP